MSRRQSFRTGAESALHARDTTGVQDFVLLEDYTNEDAFLDNLRKRFKSGNIYVSSFLAVVKLDKLLDCVVKLLVEALLNMNLLSAAQMFTLAT